jgi:putative flippase GtrA
VGLNKNFILKFLRFGVIGGVVFVFDACCFWLLLKVFGAPGIARALSVTLAMGLSWWLNRWFTFHADADRQSWTELIQFILSQLPGACVNSLTSVLAYHYLGYAMNNPWISVACGSCAGLSINFLMANFFVFKKKTGPATARSPE